MGDATGRPAKVPSPVVPPDAAGRVLLDIEPGGGGVDAIAEVVARLGGEVVGTGGGALVSARVPAPRRADLVDELAELGGTVRDAGLMQPPPGHEPDPDVENRPDTKAGATTGQHVSVTGMGAWHTAGWRGQGVKVGIIDYFDQATWNAAYANGDVPSALAVCLADGATCGWGNSGSTHGNGVAEIIHDAAPDAQLYLGSYSTLQDYSDVVDWMISQDVDVISRSLVGDYDGPGDGTGYEASLVQRAVNSGILWVNAAGNEAGGPSTSGSYYRRTGLQTALDTNGRRWVVWPETGTFLLPIGCQPFHGARWTDFGSANPTDLDVYVFDSGGTERYRGYVEQDSSATPPIEVPTPRNGGCTTGAHNMAVEVYAPGDDFNATTGVLDDRLEIMLTNGWIQGWQDQYSATGPAVDSASNGMVAVGAIDPPTQGVIADYSSQGPTNATSGRPSRIKPELSAPTNVSVSFGTFNGTSGATPVVAGAAALLKSAGVASTPAQLRSALMDRTIDRGASGTDNVYGTGELRLGTPPSGGGGGGGGGVADVVLTAKGTPATIEPADDAVYKITVKNGGTATAQGVKVLVDPPLNLDPQRVTYAGSTCPLEDQNPFGVPITKRTCTIGSLAPGASEVVTVRGTLVTDASTVFADATTTSTESSYDNNRAEATVERWTLPPGAFRLAGEDRYATAASIATDTAAPPAGGVVYLTTGENFPDALAGAPLAAKNKGSILLAKRDELPSPTVAALRTIKPAKVVALGSTGVLSDGVLQAAAREAGGATTGRIGGANRFHTAALIADQLDPTPSVAYLALGTNFPDALAASPAVGRNPILLVEKDTVPPDTVAALKRLKPGKVVALGGDAVLSNPTLFAAAEAAGTRETDRWADLDRYSTAVAIAKQGFTTKPSTVYVAVGTNFPDALGGGPPAAREVGPMLLVSSQDVPASVDAYLKTLDGLQRIVVLGGTGVISQGVMDRLEQHLDLAPPPPGSGSGPDEEPTSPDGSAPPPPPPGI